MTRIPDHSGQLVEDPDGASIDVMLDADADAFYDLFLDVINGSIRGKENA
jgi:hypothetical protein